MHNASLLEMQTARRSVAWLAPGGGRSHMKREPRPSGALAQTATFDEAGYLSIVRLENNSQMEAYVRRLVKKLGLAVRDEGALQGMVPHFSGEKSSQTFFALQQEILAKAAMDQGSWLTEASRHVSFMRLGPGARLGKNAPLNQRGYLAVAALRKNSQMDMFIRRTAKSLGLQVANFGALQGVVPFYSGVRGTQSFAKLRAELIGSIRSPRPWLASGALAMLNDVGYRAVAELKDDSEMAAFARRVAAHVGCYVADERGLRGMVPHYSGAKAVQTYSAMERDVRKACGLTSGRKVYGSMHDVVGRDGVLQVGLPGSSRFKKSAEELRSAHIVPTPFAATDATKADPSVLSKSCPLAGKQGTDALCKKREEEIGANLGLGTPGCKSKVEQAITDSHRRALLEAQRRDVEWTAIVEDDVVPVHPGYFDTSFRKAWAKVPKEARLVRLSWCSFENDLGSIRRKTYKDAGNFRIVRWMSWDDAASNSHYYTGGCTTGYIVHKSFLPELLGIFPCCCPIDCCLERQLFYAPAKPKGAPGFRGEQIMINIDAWDSKEDSFNYTTFNQGGIFLQDNRDLTSLRPEWNKRD